jgi:hypothetical protein
MSRFPKSKSTRRPYPLAARGARRGRRFRHRARRWQGCHQDSRQEMSFIQRVIDRPANFRQTRTERGLCQEWDFDCGGRKAHPSSPIGSTIPCWWGTGIRDVPSPLHGPWFNVCRLPGLEHFACTTSTRPESWDSAGRMQFVGRRLTAELLVQTFCDTQKLSGWSTIRTMHNTSFSRLWGRSQFRGRNNNDDEGDRIALQTPTDFERNRRRRSPLVIAAAANWGPHVCLCGHLGAVTGL